MSFGRVKRWLQTHSFPGFFKIPLWSIIVFVAAELKREDIFTRANAMAYSFFLALFPSIIFIFTLLPYIPVERLDEVLQQAIEDFMPANAHAFLLDTVQSIASIPRGGLLSTGFLLALFFASNGMLTMMRGFEKAHRVTFKERSYLQKRWVAVALTLLVGLAVLASGILIVGGNKVIQFVFGQDRSIPWLFTTIRWLAVVFLFYSVISMIYRLGPPLRRKFTLLSPGGTLATLLCLFTSAGFSAFINQYGAQDKLYGSLGALIVMLVWMQLNCFILLAGFELNASIAVNRDLRQIKRKRSQGT